MAKEQRKEPWNSEIYRKNSGSSNSSKRKSGQEKKPASTIFLTILVVLMFIIIAGAVVFTIWNNRYPNMNTVKDQFYPNAASTPSESSTAASASTEDTASSSEDTTASSSSQKGTYTYQGEQTLSEIEQNAGVSWATLAKYNVQLNPDWGQPGDTIGAPNKDGSYLQAGQVLKTSK